MAMIGTTAARMPVMTKNSLPEILSSSSLKEAARLRSDAQSATKGETAEFHKPDKELGDSPAAFNRTSSLQEVKNCAGCKARPQREPADISTCI